MIRTAAVLVLLAGAILFGIEALRNDRLGGGGQGLKLIAIASSVAAIFLISQQSVRKKLLSGMDDSEGLTVNTTSSTLNITGGVSGYTSMRYRGWYWIPGYWSDTYTMTVSNIAYDAKNKPYTTYTTYTQTAQYEPIEARSPPAGYSVSSHVRTPGYWTLKDFHAEDWHSTSHYECYDSDESYWVNNRYVSNWRRYCYWNTRWHYDGVIPGVNDNRDEGKCGSVNCGDNTHPEGWYAL